MRLRLLLTAVFGAIVTAAVALGATTPLPTATVWSDHVWTTAKVTTRTSTTTTYLGGFTPGANTTFASGPTVTQNERYGACMRLNVTTGSTTPVKWSVRLDTLAQPWNGGGGYRVEPDQFDLTPSGANGRYLIITGRAGLTPTRETVVKGTEHVFVVCANPGVPPIGESAWMKVTVSGPVTVDDYMVCKTITAVALGKTPFWFRWQATVPTADMFTLLGQRWSYWWSYGEDNVVRNPEPSTNPDTPSTVVVTAATNSTTTLLKDDLQYVYTLCLKGSGRIPK